tara:strand:+ start:4241 stop:4468 length:228 start_codon:yes stop_codon:yes gene_type:complete
MDYIQGFGANIGIRPEEEDFDNAVIRLLEAGAITDSVAFELTRASNVTEGEAIRVLTDIAIDRQERFDRYIETAH